MIEIPDELASALDGLAGDQSRNAFAIDLLWLDVRREKQRRALAVSSGAWKPEDHPELIDGGAEYVDRIRSEVDERYELAIHRNRQ